jgi:hypothetical protein
MSRGFQEVLNDLSLTTDDMTTVPKTRNDAHHNLEQLSPLFLMFATPKLPRGVIKEIATSWQINLRTVPRWQAKAKLNRE